MQTLQHTRPVLRVDQVEAGDRHIFIRPVSQYGGYRWAAVENLSVWPGECFHIRILFNQRTEKLFAFFQLVCTLRYSLLELGIELYQEFLCLFSFREVPRHFYIAADLSSVI